MIRGFEFVVSLYQFCYNEETEDEGKGEIVLDRLPDGVQVVESESDLGSVKIADEVVAIIAGLAATEVSGVAGMSGGLWRYCGNAGPQEFYQRCREKWVKGKRQWTCSSLWNTGEDSGGCLARAS